MYVNIFVWNFLFIYDVKCLCFCVALLQEDFRDGFQLSEITVYSSMHGESMHGLIFL